MTDVQLLEQVTFDNWVLEQLSQPFAPEEVKWRTGGGSTILAYIDARQVADRLNYVVGIQNWSDTYTPVEVKTTQIREVTNLAQVEVATKWNKKVPKNEWERVFEYEDISYGGISCELTVLGVTKSDVGTPSPSDELKGAYSDALKRAAVKFGIGSYLYELKNLQGGKVENRIVVVPPTVPDWAKPTFIDLDYHIKLLADKIANGDDIPHDHKQYVAEKVMRNYYTPSLPLVYKRSLAKYLKGLLPNVTTTNN